MAGSKIIAAVRSSEELAAAISSGADTVFMLAPNIEELQGQLEAVHRAGKKLFIHIDLAEGIGKDEYGIRYVKRMGVDGIISTRTNIIRTARKAGMFTVQRFFIVDSHSVNTTIESSLASKADMIEIMPGTMAKIIQRLKKVLSMPIVAGGLIETASEVNEALGCGADAISTGKKELWGIL